MASPRRVIAGVEGVPIRSLPAVSVTGRQRAVGEHGESAVPRFGRGGLAALVVVVLLSLQAGSPSPAAAQVVPDDTPLRLRWTWPGPVEFCADTSTLPADVSRGVFVAWVQEAMDAWNATAANVELRLASAPCTREAGNLRNEVGFELYAPGSNEVGRAHSTRRGGRPVEADVTLRLNWDSPPLCRVTTLVHEFGHVLGFTHSEEPTHIMGYGPCAVLQPSAAEVAMLVAGYGARTTPLGLASTPPSTATLTLTTQRNDYSGQSGAYYFVPSITVSGGRVLALRPPECFTAAAPRDEECSTETSLPSGYWPAYQRRNPLPEMSPVRGQTVVEPAASFGLLARPLAACNAVGCAKAADVRAGELRVRGTGVDFAYLVVPLADGTVSVQFANLSFFAPPAFLDVLAGFEVREASTVGTTGALLGECRAGLGGVCQVTGAWGGLGLDLVFVSADEGTRTGVRVEAVGVASSVPAGTGSVLISGPLPARGFALVLWNGGSVSLAASEPRIGAVFVSQGGVLRGYVVGAPVFVNAAFLAVVGAEIPAGTPVVVVVR